jgi:hypothetical protein
MTRRQRPCRKAQIKPDIRSEMRLTRSLQGRQAAIGSQAGLAPQRMSMAYSTFFSNTLFDAACVTASQ